MSFETIRLGDMAPARGTLSSGIYGSGSWTPQVPQEIWLYLNQRHFFSSINYDLTQVAMLDYSLHLVKEFLLEVSAAPASLGGDIHTSWAC